MLIGLEHYKGKKILVVGHTGFKGAWLSRVLVLSGARVFGLSLPAEPGTLKSKIENLGLEKETFLDINSRLEIDNFFTKICHFKIFLTIIFLRFESFYIQIPT